MINADYAVLVVLVSLGALIGKVNSLQLLIIALIETIFFAINESLCKQLLQISDFGQSMTVHLFGAVFGIAISRMIFDKRVCTSQALSTSNKSEMYAMIGKMIVHLVLSNEDRKLESALSTISIQPRRAHKLLTPSRPSKSNLRKKIQPVLVGKPS